MNPRAALVIFILTVIPIVRNVKGETPTHNSRVREREAIGSVKQTRRNMHEWSDTKSQLGQEEKNIY